MNKPKEYCSNCKFFRPIEASPTRGGECHRNPPNLEHVSGMGKFPRVNREDWCGEYRPKVTSMYETRLMESSPEH